MNKQNRRGLRCKGLRILDHVPSGDVDAIRQRAREKTLPHVSVEVVNDGWGQAFAGDPILTEFDRVRCRVITGRELPAGEQAAARHHRTPVTADRCFPVGRIDSGAVWVRFKPALATDAHWFEVARADHSAQGQIGGASR
jgi:hypothetical protein